LGYTVMVSNYLKHYKMLEYLSSIARGNLVGVIMGIYNLHIIFDEKYYDNLPGGLLEAFGRGFGHNVKLYIYPALNVEDGSLYHLGNIKLPENMIGLLNYMQANDKITALQEYDPSLLHILSDDVLSKIKANANSWEEDVPYEVVKAIKFFELFGYQQKFVTASSTGCCAISTRVTLLKRNSGLPAKKPYLALRTVHTFALLPLKKTSST
jgi:hypothetical protein